MGRVRMRKCVRNQTTSAMHPNDRTVTLRAKILYVQTIEVFRWPMGMIVQRNTKTVLCHRLLRFLRGFAWRNKKTKGRKHDNMTKSTFLEF